MRSGVLGNSNPSGVTAFGEVGEMEVAREEVVEDGAGDAGRAQCHAWPWRTGKSISLFMDKDTKVQEDKGHTACNWPHQDLNPGLTSQSFLPP